VATRVHGRPPRAAFDVPAAALAFDATPGSPWLLVPGDVRRSFDALRAAGGPLATSGVAVPLLGVKCGCNAAFLVQLLSVDGDVALVRAGSRTGRIERSLLRPLLRGDDLASATPSGRLVDTGEHLVWTHDHRGQPLDELPPHAARWLAPWRRALAARSDARGPRPWWSVFRTDGALHDLPRVVWSDFGRRPNAIALPAGDPHVPLNSCYVARCATWIDARALAALLGSPEIGAWLDVLAEPARGGYHRYLAWTVAQLPVPPDWHRVRDRLAREPARQLDASTADPARSSIASAYGLAASDLAPLLAWSGAASATSAPVHVPRPALGPLADVDALASARVAGGPCPLTP
jgi:hypothetical protein